MAKRTTRKAELKEEPTPTTAPPPVKNKPKAKSRIKTISADMSLQEPFSVLLHVDGGYLAIKGGEWTGDDSSTAMIETYSYDNDGNCVKTDGHKIMRRNLRYSSTISTRQCQQLENVKDEWVLAWRLP